MWKRDHLGESLSPSFHPSAVGKMQQLSCGFRNLINTAGWSGTTGLRGEPLRSVPNFTGSKETFPPDFCYDTCKMR